MSARATCYAMRCDARLSLPPSRQWADSSRPKVRPERRLTPLRRVAAWHPSDSHSQCTQMHTCTTRFSMADQRSPTSSAAAGDDDCSDEDGRRDSGRFVQPAASHDRNHSAFRAISSASGTVCTDAITFSQLRAAAQLTSTSPSELSGCICAASRASAHFMRVCCDDARRCFSAAPPPHRHPQSLPACCPTGRP